MAIGNRDGLQGLARHVRDAAAGALAGLSLGTISSAAILADRIARGDSRVVMATDAVAAASAVAVLALSRRSSFDPRRPGFGTAAAQAAGAVLGVVLVHFVLRTSPFHGCAWLCERPPQLVNDLVAALGALTLVWTCARQPLGTISSLLAVGIAALYAYTAPRWHLDAWGDALRHGAMRPISVQVAVLVQLASTAVGVSVFRRLSAMRGRALDAP